MKPMRVVLSSILAAGFAAGCATAQKPAEESQAAQAQPASAAAPAAAPAGKTYNVVRGDHLWGISAKATIYGNPYQWPLILKSNRDKIKDADLIYPGQSFSINTSPSAADVDAAVKHAKTRGAWSLGAVEASDTAYLSR